MIEDGTAPKLAGWETPYIWGYASLVVIGRQRMSDKHPHVKTLRCLLENGTPVDLPDIIGSTAIHHASGQLHAFINLLRVLIEFGGDVDHRNKYGSTPLLPSVMAGEVEAVDMLLEHGADMAIPEADGFTASKFLRLSVAPRGNEMKQCIDKWDKKRNVRCEVCGIKEEGGKPLSQCARCQNVEYCSKDCQSELYNQSCVLLADI